MEPGSVVCSKPRTQKVQANMCGVSCPLAVAHSRQILNRLALQVVWPWLRSVLAVVEEVFFLPQGFFFYLKGFFFTSNFVGFFFYLKGFFFTSPGFFFTSEGFYSTSKVFFLPLGCFSYLKC